MDFFLAIYLNFFFTLLPFYVTDNSQLLELAANRSIQNRNIKVKDMEVMIKQVIYLIFLIVNLKFRLYKV